MVDVSVIIPCFNAVDYVQAAVTSAFCQENVEIEVILVDDLSTDATRQVLKQLESSDQRIRVHLSSENRGPSAARNVAIAMAIGEWVAVLDADDTYLPGRLSHMVSSGRKAEADVVSDDILIRDFSGVKNDEPARVLPENATIIGEAEYFSAAVPKGGSYDIGFLKPIIRREFLVDNKISYREDIRVGEDFLLYAHLVLAGGKFLALPDAGYVYRQTPTSITANSRDNTPILLRGVDELLSFDRRRISAESILLLVERKRVLLRRQNWRQMRALRRSSKIEFVFAALKSPRKMIDFVMEAKAAR